MSQSSLCYKCHQPSETLKRCSGCEKVWYCSTECHSAHWVEHIFDCVPRRPITTADHLALAVHTNILPLHKQTSSEYGFDSAWTASNRMFLLKIYTGLIKELGVSPKTIRKWRAAGILLNEIKREFPILLIQRHGQPYLACFSWLLENEWVLNGQSPEHSLSLRINGGLQAFERAWHLLGGPRDVDLEEANMIVLQWPPDKRDCFEFYRGAVINWYPLRSVPRWLWFGFCACAGEKDEYDLNNRYVELMEKCTFDEFCAAFRNSTFLDLFQAKAVPINNRFIRDVLQHGRESRKSVWDLKQFVVTDDGEVPNLPPRIAVDYGFTNCVDAQERSLLKGAYKQLFLRPNLDPLKLHEACMSGRLARHVGSVIKLSPRGTFVRLMKNPYPA